MAAPRCTMYLYSFGIGITVETTLLFSWKHACLSLSVCLRYIDEASIVTGIH